MARKKMKTEHEVFSERIVIMAPQSFRRAIAAAALRACTTSSAFIRVAVIAALEREQQLERKI